MYLRSLALALILTTTTRADVITFQQMSSGPFNTAQFLSFPQFNPALGELTAVRWTASGASDPLTVQFDNESSSPFNGSVLFQTLIGFGAPGVFLEGFISTLGVGLNLTPDDEPGPPDFAGPDFAQRTVQFRSIFTPSSESAPLTSFPFYIGTGLIRADFGARTIQAIPSSGPAPAFRILGVEEAAAVTATVSYEFTPVPEPTTLALVGLTIVTGAGLQRYRRQRAAVVTNHQV